MLVEASENLRKTQQDQLLKFLQEDQKIFLSYDIRSDDNKSKKKTKRAGEGRRPSFDFDQPKCDIDRFFNQDQNFSITWYSSLKDYYNDYLKDRLALVDKITDRGKKAGELT